MSIWKDIKGYEGLYQVSNEGEVRRLWKSKTHILSPSNSLGYSYVNLCKHGKATRMTVHRLVAEAFVPNPDGKPEVNHINELKSDNRAKNLEWMTSSENQNHGTANARRRTNARAYKRVLQMSEGEVINRYPSLKEASRATGISVSNLSRCCRGVLNTVRGFQWKFDDVRQ